MCSLIDQLDSAVINSILCIPLDIIDHHIFKQLNTSSLVACSLVCRKLRTHSSRQLSAKPKFKYYQSRILSEIFGDGSLELLHWFQARLGYPSIFTDKDTAVAQFYLFDAAESCLILSFLVKFTPLLTDKFVPFRRPYCHARGGACFWLRF